MKLAAIALLAASIGASAEVFQKGDTEDVVPGEYIVALHDQMNAKREFTMFEMVNKMGGRVKSVYNHGFSGFSLAGLTDEQAQELTADPMVKYVEPNYIQYIQQQPACVERASTNWGLERINLENARTGAGNTDPIQFKYDQNDCGEGVDLYILDTGVRRDHDDFAGRNATNVGDYVNPSRPVDGDDQGHGTHVASTAGGNVYGVAKCANVRSLKVCNAFGQCPADATMNALQKVVDDLKADPSKKIVVNMSLGGGFRQSSNDNANAAAAAGAIVVVAAGNSNADSCNFSPASAERAYSVMSSDVADRKSSFSNYGRCSQMWAPGSSITAALHTGASNAVRTISGTSMATPHVAGAMAVVWGANPGLTNVEVEKIVTEMGMEGKISGDNNRSPNLLLHLPCDN